MAFMQQVFDLNLLELLFCVAIITIVFILFCIYR